MTPAEATLRARQKIAAAQDSITAYASGQKPPQSNPLLYPCSNRGESVGKLVCNCTNKPDAYRCNAEFNTTQRCIVSELSEPWDGQIVGDGDKRYLPWHGQSIDMEPFCSLARIPVCSLCRERNPPFEITVQRPRKTIWKDEIVYVTTETLIHDTIQHVLPRVSHDVEAIVAIPRSGLLPATVIATAVHRPLFVLSGEGVLIDVGSGARGNPLSKYPRKFLVVDDSVYSGYQMSKARDFFKGDVEFAAVYCTDPSAVDICGVEHQGIHLFEWNLFNNATNMTGRPGVPVLEGGVALDFDGVICKDPTQELADDEEGWLRWMDEVQPNLLPRGCSVPLIVSFRIEAWRDKTERWMNRWGVKCDRLVLHPAKTHKERDESFNVAEHKGEVFGRSKCQLMVESNPIQASIIARHTKKVVICNTTGEVFHGK